MLQQSRVAVQNQNQLEQTVHCHTVASKDKYDPENKKKRKDFGCIHFSMKTEMAAPTVSVMNKSGLRSKAANLSNKASVILAACAAVLL